MLERSLPREPRADLKPLRAAPVPFPHLKELCRLRAPGNRGPQGSSYRSVLDLPRDRPPRFPSQPHAPNRKGTNGAEVGTEPERRDCEPISSGLLRRLLESANRHPAGRGGGCGPEGRGARRPVAACQSGRCRSGARLRRSVSPFRRASKDERAEDAGPRAAQVKEPRCRRPRLGFSRDSRVLNGEDRGDAEPRLVAAGRLPELQLPERMRGAREARGS